MALDTVKDFLFGKPLTPEETVKKWKGELRTQMRGIDRNIRGIEREEYKVRIEIKLLLKRGDKSGAKMLAKELVRSRKAKNRLHVSKAHMNSVLLQLQQNLAQYKLAGSMKASAEIMATMNQAIRLPEIHNAMVVLATEMQKSGLIEEMIDDMMSDEEVEDEAEEEVDKVLMELALNTQADMPAMPVKRTAAEEQAEEGEADDADTLLMQDRLNALKGV